MKFLGQNGCRSGYKGYTYVINHQAKHLKRGVFLLYTMYSLIAHLVKNPMQETLVQFLGWEDLVEKG